MSTLEYTTLDNNFSQNSQKIQNLGSGTFGQVSYIKTPHGNFVSKETKIDNKSLGYPPDFLTEIDVMLKFRKLPAMLKIQGLNFDLDQKKGRILLEVMSCNLSEWCRKTPFAQRIVAVPILIKEIGGTLAVMHLFEFLHNDIKTNNILVDTTVTPPRFKLADFGITIRVKDEERTVYGGIDKYKPPNHRNIYESEYWAFMVVLTEVILGSRLVEGADGSHSFYWKYSNSTGFLLSSYLENKLKNTKFMALPEEYWTFVNPILYEKNPRIAISMKRIFDKTSSVPNGPRTPRSLLGLQAQARTEIEKITINHFDSFISRNIISEISNDISKDVGKQPSYDIIKDEVKNFLTRKNLIEYYSRFNRLFNKFLSTLTITLSENILRKYMEVALIIILKSRITHYTHFSSEKEFLLFERAFLDIIEYQTVVI